jgi:hypothetical protein
MSGGLAVRANLLCVSHSSARGRIHLFDLEARAPLSRWDLPAGPGGYSDAAGMAMDERFHLFVADTQNGCVRHFSAFGRHLADFGRPPRPDSHAARDQKGVLDRPHAVAVLDDRVLVSCGERPLRRGVQCFDREGHVLRPLLPDGDPEGWFGAPRGLWADNQGILVADTLHGRVQRFRTDGTFIAGFRTGRGHDVASRPQAVVRVQGGHILVVDAGDEPGLRMFSAGGHREPVPADLLARTEQPTAFARDEHGRLYVLDRHGERVLRFSAALAFDAELVDLTEHLDGT